MTDIFHTASPTVSISVDKFFRFIPFGNGQEQAVMSLNVDADLRSSFSWNTKQLFVQIQVEFDIPSPLKSKSDWDADELPDSIDGANFTTSTAVSGSKSITTPATPSRTAQVVVWDAIIQNTDQAWVQSKGMRPKYVLSDPGSLRGRAYNLTMVWNVMPKVGYLYSRKHTASGGVFPENYIY
eukprot:CAMPEP_0175042982 /NCGR_PEP_ID=MMETSP0052_2-20121109/2897_1 /TAXON_ID=51329 ORGANISM="Polytomella parva, Strain SAG 63-3" /NCGR_SAMPLE_ID=MMETSP0052_2 /ASSEMBLY_ACC=CAM_ASM_000194 /LENGTH=181 /DNA_ID=CAMNT_0016305917 /DNA_START=210 /DNA_END=755 /DNA_ORIENTATION=+